MGEDIGVPDTHCLAGQSASFSTLDPPVPFIRFFSQLPPLYSHSLEASRIFLVFFFFFSPTMTLMAVAIVAIKGKVGNRRVNEHKGHL